MIKLGVDNTVVQFQRSYLEKNALEKGAYSDFLYFLALSKDFEEVESYKSAAYLSNIEGKLTYQLLFAPYELPTEHELVERCGSITNPWLVYTVGKHLLSKNQYGLASRLIQQGMTEDEILFPLLNLIAHTACFFEKWSVALEIAQLSLDISGEQKDIDALISTCKLKKKCIHPPNLDIFPRLFTVSYYLPCYNVEQYVEASVQGILTQNYPIQELLIIDDASPDNTLEIVSQYPVRVISHETNRGLAAARNTGWRAASSDFVGSVDTDAVLAPNYTQCAFMEYEQGGNALAAVGGRLCEKHTDTFPDFWRARCLSQDHGHKRRYMGKVPANLARLSEEEQYFYNGFMLNGSNTILKRAAIEAVGGYDEERRTNAEDSKLCACFRKAGFEYVFIPQCLATHLRRDTLSSVLRTAWNYAYWAWAEGGYYTDGRKVLTLLKSYVERGQTFLRLNHQLQYHGLFYIDFMYTLHSIFRDLNHLILIERLSIGEAKSMQLCILDEVKSFAASISQDFEQRVLEDCEEFLFGSEVEPEILQGDWSVITRVLVEDLKYSYAEYDDEIKALLAASCEHIRSDRLSR